jgi:leader peptidase (prepilin peptidase)/N-methyltransferase
MFEWALLGLLVGAATGSFAGVVVERLPAGRTPNGRSVCVCGRQLRGWENVPLLSWLLLRGRARCCGARIPAWYLGVEAVAAAVGLTAGAIAGVVGVVAAAAVITGTAFAVAVRRRTT